MTASSAQFPAVVPEENIDRAGRGLRPMWGVRSFAAVALITAVMPALLLDESNARLVVPIVGVAAAGLAVGEWFAERGSSRRPARREFDRSFGVSLVWVFALGAVVGLLLAGAFNTLSIEAVYSGYQYGVVSTVSRMLMALTAPAVALAVWSNHRGWLSARTTWILSGGLVLLTLAVSLKGGYLSVAIPVGVVFLVLGSMTHLIRLRHLAVGTVLLAVLLPLMFQVRDDVREDLGGTRSSEGVGPMERFRVDLLMSDLENAVPASWVDLPDPGLLARTAVVPRVLDPQRPIIDVGQQITYARGFGNANNSTFGHYGNVFWMYSWLGVACVSLSLGVLFGLGFRLFDSGVGAILLSAVTAPTVWLEAAFPAYWSGIVQSLLLSFSVVAVTWLVRQIGGAGRRV